MDDDFELDLEAVDVVSSAFAVVSLDFNAVASDSILAATAPVMRDVALVIPFPVLFLVRGGICRVHKLNDFKSYSTTTTQY